MSNYIIAEVMKRCAQHDPSLAMIDEWTMLDRLSACITELCLVSCWTIYERMSVSCPELCMILSLLSWNLCSI
jgi:hypothetical protein